MPVKVIASSLALIGFAVAIAAGIAAGNTAVTILVRALGAMLGCWVIGFIVASVARRAVLEHVEQYKQTHPIPRVEDVEASMPAASENAAPTPPQDAAESSDSDKEGGDS